MSGFVLLYRDLIAHPAFRNDAEAMAFAWMFAKAAWKECRVRYKGRAFALNRGQLAISQRDMAASLDRDKAWVERLWRRLRDEAMIEVAYEAGAAVVTICNYDKYQTEPEEREAPDEAPEEADARQAQGTEQIREQGNKEEREPRKRARRTVEFQVPDWVPAEPWAAYCAMRARKKAAVDSYIAGRVFEKLEKIGAAGWDIAKVLDKATLNNWTDVWMPTPGRDDDLRAGPNGTPAKPIDTSRLDEFKALKAKRDNGEITREEFFREQDRLRAEPRQTATGPPRPIGELAQRQLSH
jgi:hypothetical protein